MTPHTSSHPDTRAHHQGAVMSNREAFGRDSDPDPSSLTDNADIAQLQERLAAIYTPLELALEELHSRRHAMAGRTPGRDWLPCNLPGHQQGCAFLSRYIATPNHETHRFLELADGAGLLPVIAGFALDKFVTRNPLKRALARMGFHCGYNRHGHSLVEFVNVLNDNQQGRTLESLQTFWGQSLIEFHHELLAHSLNGGRHPHVFDASSQCARAGGNTAACYREFYLRLCVADGILFEDFLLDNMELPFTRDIVLPAFDEVTARFGLRPLIVHMTTPGEQDLPHWSWYPRDLKAFVQERLLLVS